MIVKRGLKSLLSLGNNCNACNCYNSQNYEYQNACIAGRGSGGLLILNRLAGDHSIYRSPALYNAFSYGAPPHAGSAPGFDRLMMLLTHNEFIRDVIAFPMNKNACDPLTNAPTVVDEKALRDVHIMLRPEVENK